MSDAIMAEPGDTPGGFSLALSGICHLVMIRTHEKDFLFLKKTVDESVNHDGIERLVSPLFPVVPHPNVDPLPENATIHFVVTGSSKTLFSSVAAALTIEGLHIFLTLGNCELICAHGPSVEVEQVKKLLTGHDIAVETWFLGEHGIVERICTPSYPSKAQEELDFRAIKSCFPENSGYLEREIQSLIVRRRDGSALTLRDEKPRAQDYLQTLHVALTECEDKHHKFDELWRFSGTHTYSVTQRFTCLPPCLYRSPCPIGGFELLGVGKALRAVKQFGEFVFQQITKSRLAGCLESFADGQPSCKIELPVHGGLDPQSSKKLSDDLIILRNQAGLDIHRRAMQSSGSKPDQSQGTVSPIVHYFSARHGFQFEGTGISLPLQTVSSANTFHWNLMNLSHEYSHVISGTILSAVREWLQTHYERLVKELFDECANGAAGAKLTGTCPLDLLCKAILYRTHQGESVTRDQFIQLSQSIMSRDFRPENEVMTHIFDLAYFYRGDFQRHATMYWSHWLHLPGVCSDESTLIRYIVRTCCALAAAYLDSPGKYSDSLATSDLIKGLIRNLNTSPDLKRHGIEKILQIIEDDEKKQLVDRTCRHFLPLVCVTQSLLVLSSTREWLWHGVDETSRTKLNQWRSQLRIEYNVLSGFFNPLQLISLEPFDPNTSEEGSLWLLSLLDALSWRDQNDS